ncbi:hypothetical protein MKEN_00966300 [Mycena kentingensis (nom. inval.)]|nr:hypothetical protein MKEN_00966300 [Mycena kentingensis (nom. inval.)]
MGMEMEIDPADEDLGFVSPFEVDSDDEEDPDADDDDNDVPIPGPDPPAAAARPADARYVQNPHIVKFGGQAGALSEKLGLSYRTSRELNQIIDDILPSGRPSFERHEIKIGGQVEDFFCRPLIPCVRALFGDPEYAADLIFAPERHYTDADATNRIYCDVHTGKWWWATQVRAQPTYAGNLLTATQKILESEKPGATILPLIISTDKAQTTTFRNKSCYPMYATIANIPEDIRCKPSRGAYILVGYLPTTRLEHIKNARRGAAL